MENAGPASQNLTVFLSSTYIDLQPCRKKVEDALTRIQASFRSMSFFGSKEGDPLEECLRKVRECNYYVGIIGHRYGSLHEASGKSITELEYEEAKRLGVSRRIYMAGPSVSILPEQVEADEKRALLEAFKLRLKKENTFVEFSSPDDLAVKVLSDIILGLPEKEAIAKFAKEKYLPAIRKTCESISFLGLDVQAMKRHRDVKLERVYVHSRFQVVRTLPSLLDNAGYVAVAATDSGLAANAVASAGIRAKVHTATSALKSQIDSLAVLSSFNAPVTVKLLRLRDLILGYKNTVVLGDPGSGKTTLAKYIVVACVDRLPEVDPVPTGAIPIRVPLRAYAEFRERAGGVGVSILEFIVAQAKTELQLATTPEHFFDFYLDGGMAILIFDGLDEIFDSGLREQVRNDVVNFTQIAFPGNRVLVTSRKVGYEEAGFPEPDFTHAEILRFDDKQISEYVEKWYCLEEADRHKRRQEIAAFKEAVTDLPEELVSNPLLLSLIVILFRAGCTIPDSKLEIYRSCVGTLTEKWDAAGKRLEVPEEYNLVRDKRGAFARIAYWMYQQSSAGSEKDSRPTYPTIISELGRHLRDREFKGKEGEAENAATNFLDYAAKRSVFVEDRFSHKTFQEYFAALYIFRNFCVGRASEVLYREIKPYLSSDYWSVVLELLLVMIDEHSGQLVDEILSRIVAEALARSETLYSMLLLPLRALSQLRNVAEEATASLVSAAMEICLNNRAAVGWEESAWGTGPRKPGRLQHSEGGPHQRLFSALEELPARFHPVISQALRRAAASANGDTELLPVAAFCVELQGLESLKPEEIVPNWSSVGGALARLHAGVFFRVSAADDIPSRLQRFVSLLGTERLFKYGRLLFRPDSFYLSAAEYALYMLIGESRIRAYEAAITGLLRLDYFEDLFHGFIALETVHGGLAFPEAALRHLAKGGKDPQEHLVDWVVLYHGLGHPRHLPSKADPPAARLKRISVEGTPAQRFYSCLLLRTALPAVTERDLGLSPRMHEAVRNAALRLTAKRGKLQTGRARPGK